MVKNTKKKLDKDELICQVIERLCVTSEKWKSILEQATWQERVFLLKKKKEIDRLCADYKSLTS
jgi:hypothetical protein